MPNGFDGFIDVSSKDLLVTFAVLISKCSIASETSYAPIAVREEALSRLFLRCS